MRGIKYNYVELIILLFQIYQLKIGGSLSPYLSTVESMPATQALVLVNTTDSLKLDQTYFTEGQTPPVPTVVIGKSNGEKILDFLREYGRDLKICTQCFSFEDLLVTEKADEEGEKNLEEANLKEKVTDKKEDLISIPMGKSAPLQKVLKYA